ALLTSRFLWFLARQYLCQATGSWNWVYFLRRYRALFTTAWHSASKLGLDHTLRSAHGVESLIARLTAARKAVSSSSILGPVACERFRTWRFCERLPRRIFRSVAFQFRLFGGLFGGVWMSMVVRIGQWS